MDSLPLGSTSKPSLHGSFRKTAREPQKSRIKWAGPGGLKLLEHVVQLLGIFIQPVSLMRMHSLDSGRANLAKTVH